jgi:hypothetical protein
VFRCEAAASWLRLATAVTAFMVSPVEIRRFANRERSRRMDNRTVTAGSQRVSSHLGTSDGTTSSVPRFASTPHPRYVGAAFRRPCRTLVARELRLAPMRTWIAVLLLISGVTYAAPAPSVQFADASRRQKLATAFADIDRTFSELVRKSHVPGAAWGIVIDGELAHTGTTGCGKPYLDRLESCVWRGHRSFGCHGRSAAAHDPSFTGTRSSTRYRVAARRALGRPASGSDRRREPLPGPIEGAPAQGAR